MSPSDLKFRPLTPATWPQLEVLFGERGACGGCWCMWLRLKRSDFVRQKGEGNRNALKRIVEARRPTGVLAFAGREAVGWCAVAPREDYTALERSRTLKRVDEQPVWSITCLFIARPWRRKGLIVPLLEAASDYARRKGAKIVEAYPFETGAGRLPDAFAWMGPASAFRKAGFAEVLRRSKTRPIMRRTLPGVS